ncbi:hypothetical protein QQS21_004637 [Conoideocrella luteorostrata]|uniref:AB hydrolase-1 domain-containing protein n=1 Tax=Conoideocrella luteorostrata TaxID=1105319 RepID=A0AAJ0FUG1_9HYPO|nr:hypothetical protein QQS21_004637 [Conoideocrella luteorostrata]
MSQTAHFDIKEHIVPGCYIREYPSIVKGRQEELLHLHVKQYTPRDGLLPNRDAVTLIAMHGIGLPKELYEPLWDTLYEQSASCGFSIRAIWIADMASHGGSGILNEKTMSNDFSWMDHARDVLSMINHFHEQMPRPLIGVGHSCGGLQMAQLSFMHPRLFTSLIFLDPGFIVSPTPLGLLGDGPGPVNFNTYRRDLWRNRAAAASFVENVSPDWDKRAIGLMVKYGFRDLPTALYPELPPNANLSDPPVTLTTTKHQSCLAQIRPCFDLEKANGRFVVNRETHPDLDAAKADARVPFYRPELFPTMDRLPTLRPSALFVLGKDTTKTWKDSMRNAARIAGTGVGGSGGMEDGRIREVFAHGGHMFPFTAVLETAQACAAWIGDEIGRYSSQEKKWNNERSKMSERAHLVVPAKWMEIVRHPKDIKTKL